MKTLVLRRNMIMSIFAVMLLIYGVGISYGQPGAPTVTPGETNTSMVVRFQITLDEGVDENAYQIHVRRKTPQGEWISKCVVIKRGIRHEIAGDPDVFASAEYVSGIIFHFGDYSDDTFNIDAIFTNLDLGTIYEVRYRDTNSPVCIANPPSPDPWSAIAEGVTHLVAPPHAEFIDANLAKKVRDKLGLDIVGGHIELLKIPQVSLAKVTKLKLDDEEITDLTGLEHAVQLVELYLSYNQIRDVTPLAHLTQLIHLDLSDNQISDITPLAHLTLLTLLELDRNQISDISPLAQLTQLTRLWLWDNQISDVTLLTTFASLENLRSISLRGNPITDISPVEKLKRENPNLSISIDIPVILINPNGEPDLSIPTIFVLKGDVNGDGIVNIQDLVLVAGKLGQTGTNSADVNGDGVVNIQDLVLVAGALGTSAAAPSPHPQTLEMLTTTEIKQWLSAAQQLDLMDTRSQRGILFLQQLLVSLTPKETSLLPNFPNPFNPETWIPYHLAKDADVTLHIYTMNGTLVRTLTLGHQAAGLYQNRSRAAYWDGKNAQGEPVASGIYFYTLTAGDFTATRKMLIRK